MSLRIMEQQILNIMAENVKKNHNPGLVDTNVIACQLNLSLKKTKQILKSMEGVDVIQTSMDGEYSLITKKGLNMINASQKNNLENKS